MALTSGMKLGPYEIQSPLGSGGMGEVYRASDTRLHRTVAIKILPEHLWGSPDARLRFDREAQALSSFSHPNICHLYDVGEKDGTNFLVMEYLEGTTLADRLRKGPLPLEQVLKVGAEICSALDKAHRSAVVHRDLKPGNIMLTKSGAKLMDFGLAKASTVPLGSLSSSNSLATMSKPLTTEGAIVGTIQYMSPEQLEGKEADARSDIFSLGAVLYEMVTGKRAFEGKTTASTIAAILAAEPKPISAFQPTLPNALDHIIKACLAKDPDERLQTAHDVDLQLGWLMEGRLQSGVLPGVAQSKRNQFWVTTVVAVLALIAGFGLANFTRTSTEPLIVRSSIIPPEKANFFEGASEWAPPVLSPDGSRIVVGVITETGQQILYVRSLNALSGQVLSGTEGGVFPFWSPDGRTIGFFADGQLKNIDASGGAVHELCPAPQPRGGTWSKDGVIVFAPSPYTGLFRVAATGGPSVQLTRLDTSRHEDSHRWPRFLPDGRHFLYLARTSNRSTSEIRVASIASIDILSIVPADGNSVYVAPGFLLYPRSNLLMAQPFDAARLRTSGEPIIVADQVSWNGNVDYTSFTASDNGSLAYMGVTGQGLSELLWTDRSGKALGKVGEPAPYFGPSLSPDGKKLAVEIADPRNASSEIWIYDLIRNSRTRLTFTSANSHNRLPVWSPDGSQIAFSSDRDGRAAQIYEKAVDGRDPEHVVAPSESDRYPSTWSPDGRYLIGVEQSAQRGSEFLVLPMLESQRPFDFLPGVAGLSRFTFPRVSPDGRWLAYSTFETGRQEIYISSFPSGAGKWQVSTADGTEPYWRRDGKELFYRTLDATLMSAEISEQNGSPVVGRPRPLFLNRTRASPHWTFDVSPDGQRILINRLVQPSVSEPITLVTNWEAELKK
ncbi:MAG TPA: protein kinase [Candidatus Sulfotelmatobacter sp.]|nr:protein kinase [Candidatus Sulfotelmatobacter sp.]